MEYLVNENCSHLDVGPAEEIMENTQIPKVLKETRSGQTIEERWFNLDILNSEVLDHLVKDI